MTVIEFPARNQGKTLHTDRIIAHCITDNREIIIGTSYPNLRIKELRERFPSAKFEICEMGVKLCSR